MTLWPLPDDVIPFAILIGTGLVIVAVTKVLSVVRLRYNRWVLARAQAIVDQCETAGEPLNAHFGKVDFPVYANLLAINYEVQVDLYVHSRDRRLLLNRLFLLNLLCSLTSFLMPIFVLVALINYHNNVFRYPV